MAYTDPTIDDFKAFFARDFPFGTDQNTSVLDADIVKAFAFVNVNVNAALYSTQQSYTIGYQLLTAHYLVTNLRASSQGINGQYTWLEQSKSAGSVAASFGIPTRILENPDLAMLCQTNYGAQFIQLLLPQLTGNVFIAYGSTRP